MAMLQAHRGVSTEYPENTMAAVTAAIEQGYDYIEIDPAITKDGVVVLLHDASITRTARNNDGTPLKSTLSIGELSYEEAFEYDFGVWFHPKFKGERLPELESVLKLAKAKNVKIKLDNKIWGFNDPELATVLALVKDFPETAAVTCATVDQVGRVLSVIPLAQIHYDGQINEDLLTALSALVPKSRLFVWAKASLMTKAQSDMIKSCASLGVWTVSEYDEFERMINLFGADIIETNGQIKPIKTTGVIADMHSHTVSSHDARSDIDDLCQNAIQNGVSILAITDHFDGVAIGRIDPYKVALSSTQSVDNAAPKYKDQLTLLKGIELGEAFWAKKELAQVMRDFKFDVIIGSVHAVRYNGFEAPFAIIDFSDVELKTIKEFYHQYLDDMIENMRSIDFDILAHLDNPMKYLRGKFGVVFDMSEYAEKIDTILKYIIEHGIAMEINTATVDLYGECMPSWDIVQRYRELGGYIITIGADSHFPQNVGKHIAQVRLKLKDMGFHNVYYYKDRKSCPITI